MCLGIPCVGMMVRMRDSYVVAGVRIPGGAIGRIIQEFRDTREVRVHWQLPRGIVEATVPADVVEVIGGPTGFDPSGEFNPSGDKGTGGQELPM